MGRFSGRRGATASLAAEPAASAPAHGSERRGGFRLTTFSSLRYRDYRLLWLGILFTSAGMWMENVALNWLVYDMTGSAAQLGILNACRAFPAILIGLFGGVAADRFDPKRLMLITQWLLLVMYLALGALITADVIQVWHVYLFSLATALTWSFNQPVRQVTLPLLVPREQLVNAVALQSAGFQVTRLLGPAVAGFLIAKVGTDGAIYAEAATWVAVIILTMMMRIPPRPATGQPRRSVRADMAIGLRYIFKTPSVRALILMAFVPFVVVMPYMTLLTIVAKDTFHMDASGLGLLMSVSGAGALAASLGVASLGEYRGKGKVLIGFGYASALALLGFAVATWLPFAYAMLIVLAGTSMGYLALSNTLLNMIVPDELRGRVMAVYMMDRGLQPLGSVFGGLLTEWYDVHVALAVLGALALLSAVVFTVAFPHIRKLE